MSKKLQVLVLTHVILHVLVHGTSIIGSKVLHRQGQGLFVAFHECSTGSISDTRNAWRHHVVYRHTVVVFLNIYSRNGKVRIGTACHVASI